MQFVIDVHLHSRYARATSPSLNPESMHQWSALKGVDVVGTGDFTHPEWFAELQEQLEPADEGLFQLKETWRRPIEKALPPSCRRPVRFMLSVEISSIYKKNGRTRKIHNVVILPSFAAVARLNQRLGAIGNLASDGRPILGLDSRDLLEICLEVCPDVLFIPAHIWTPHFAVLGSASGFDSLEECFEDLLPHIFAVETGLSADPPMLDRLSALDRYAVVSNSDAHSPQKLAREATCFNTERSYPGIYHALRDQDPERFRGTLEFYPEEGKYHYDGHRKCQIRWKPAQTLTAEGFCPVCGRKLTVGVLHRVELLADRPEGSGRARPQPFEYLVPLPEIIGAAIGVGPSSKKVQAVYEKLLAALGPELGILRRAPAEDIARHSETLVAEGVRRMRSGDMVIEPGYDGEYGIVQVFTAEERDRLRGQAQLFSLPQAAPPPQAPPPQPAAPAAAAAAPAPVASGGLDAEQTQAVQAQGGPVLVVAGPGSGKTRTLTHRIDHLVRGQGVAPAAILAATFTKRAAGELRQRLQALLTGVEEANQLRVGTFHRLALDLLAVCRIPPKSLLDEVESRALISAALKTKGLALRPARVQEVISLAKGAAQRPTDLEGDWQRAYRAYQDQLQHYGACDYDDILLDLLDLLEGDAQTLAELRRRFTHLLVDEFQDLNTVQYRLVRLLAGGGQGLFVIGDPDQAIYGFRGAQAAHFDDLRGDFPQTQRFHLGTNYRSGGSIVRAGAALIGRNPDRQPLDLEAVRPDGPGLELLSVPGPTAEGIAVVRQISRLLGGADLVQADQLPGAGESERGLDDFAVLYRTGQQGDLIEECFLKEGLPYRRLGHKSLLQARSVRQALAFFRLGRQPDQTERLLAQLDLPGLPLKDLQSPLPEICLAEPASGPLEAVRLALVRYRDLADRVEAADLLQAWRDEFWPGPDEDLDQLIGLAHQAPSLDQLLDTVLLGREADFERRGQATAHRLEAVTLTTLHASKGLEFGVVFITGLEDGLIPLEGTDTAEERRLFYVGITRAQDRLFLLKADRRTRRGHNGPMAPSRFIEELPADLLERQRAALPPVKEQAEQLSLW